MTLPEGVQRRTFDGETSLATKGTPVYGEPTKGGWRQWDPSRSKLGAMLELGLDVGLEGGETVLYLGAANGTTVSHVADFCGPTYAIEFAPRPMRDLLEVAQTRPNIIPQLADARRPGQYRHVVEAGVDVIIQDVATRDQASVAIQNSPFLAPDGRVVAAIKARSEDVTKKPESVFEEVLERLREKYYIDQTKRLDAFHTDHLAVIAHPQERGLPSSGSI